MTAREGQRYDELDSLRGLAAVTVVFGHLSMMVFCGPSGPLNPQWNFWRHLIVLVNYTPLTVIMSGGAAVRFFFVLSGFVLMLPFLRKKDNPYFPFLVKRICRIWMPYVAAIGFALIFDAWLGQRTLPGFSGAINNTWNEPITWHRVIQHVLMLGVFPAAQYNTVLWSLVQEMRISIVFPLLALAVLKLSTRGLVLLVLLLEAGTALIPIFHPAADLSLQSFPETIHFISFFLLGAVLAKNREPISNWLSSISKWSRAAIALFAFLMYTTGIKTLWSAHFNDHVLVRVMRAFPHAAWASSAALGYMNEAAGDWIAALCAATAICFALVDRRTKAVLNHKLVLWTGRASYTLYLVHATVLFALLFGLYQTRWFSLLVPAYIVGTIVATILFYRFVERPTMALGKKLARMLTPAPRDVPETKPMVNIG
ncbi:acyltransferase family protein [Paracidobacterium acidisoli]|uniref:Acyltransferase n=1 Tax=Paracidobacterium acidisoli TaxID=2303751 RepID=A0A372IRN8_9BACT|nr:acyltransferase [Paracidobacterium acidisoli]MBT9330461.1 acyltransferase [Paracidobacterium acidisoli]